MDEGGNAVNVHVCVKMLRLGQPKVKVWVSSRFAPLQKGHSSVTMRESSSMRPNSFPDIRRTSGLGSASPIMLSTSPRFTRIPIFAFPYPSHPTSGFSSFRAIFFRVNLNLSTQRTRISQILLGANTMNFQLVAETITSTNRTLRRAYYVGISALNIMHIEYRY